MSQFLEINFSLSLSLSQQNIYILLVLFGSVSLENPGLFLKHLTCFGRQDGVAVPELGGAGMTSTASVLGSAL